MIKFSERHDFFRRFAQRVWAVWKCTVLVLSQSTLSEHSAAGLELYQHFDSTVVELSHSALSEHSAEVLAQR